MGTVPPVPTGTYRLQLEVTDGIDIVRSAPRTVRIAGVAPTPSASPSPSAPRSPSAIALAPTGSSPAAPIAIGAGGVLALALALLLLRRIRRRPARSTQG